MRGLAIAAWFCLVMLLLLLLQRPLRLHHACVISQPAHIEDLLLRSCRSWTAGLAFLMSGTVAPASPPRELSRSSDGGGDDGTASGAAARAGTTSSETAAALKWGRAHLCGPCMLAEDISHVCKSPAVVRSPLECTTLGLR